MFKFLKDMASTIMINGKTFVGKRINVLNDKVYIDNKLVEEGLSGILKVEVTGNLASLDCNAAEVHGNVGTIDANTVSITGDVQGDVDANTVTCGIIRGNVEANVVNSHI